MEAAGTLDNFQSALENMIDMYKTNAVFKDIPASFWKDFEKEFKKIDVDEIIETFMPVYYKYYTEDDLRQLISFYQSPVGIKMKKNTANIMQESMQLGEKWGREIGEKVAAKLQKELEKKN